MSFKPFMFSKARSNHGELQNEADEEDARHFYLLEKLQEYSVLYDQLVHSLQTGFVKLAELRFLYGPTRAYQKIRGLMLSRADDNHIVLQMSETSDSLIQLKFLSDVSNREPDAISTEDTVRLRKRVIDASASLPSTLSHRDRNDDPIVSESLLQSSFTFSTPPATNVSILSSGPNTQSNASTVDSSPLTTPSGSASPFQPEQLQQATRSFSQGMFAHFSLSLDSLIRIMFFYGFFFFD